MLYILPTPIGNLEDITHRALRILNEADYILAEDTRNTSRLLAHFDIQNTLRPFHAHNEHRVVDDVIRDLRAGQTLALVTDAGTPGISDPAFLLVKKCIEEGVPYSCLPGATAFVPALVMSGLPINTFAFLGFLPHKKGRATKWNEIANNPHTVVLYESPHRLLRFLREAAEHLDEDREMAVVREISKVHEEIHRGSASELLDFFEANPSKVRGEIVVVVGR